MKKHFVASFIALALIIPFFGSAATLQELQAQINALLSQITALQNATNGSFATSQAPICPNLYRTLSRGDFGNDVRELQQFLVSQGLLNADSITGFFGPLTEAAVREWQTRNDLVSSGDSNSTGYGVVGPRTRAAIAARCGSVPRSCPLYQSPICPAGTQVQAGPIGADGCNTAPFCAPTTNICPVNMACAPGYSTSYVYENGCQIIRCTLIEDSSTLDANPSTGRAPLAVVFTGTVQSSGYILDFGDGSSATQVCGFVGCAGSAQVNQAHTYATAGTYTARLKKIGSTNSPCLSSDCVVATETVVVTNTTTTQSFTASPSSGNAPLTVVFSGSIDSAGYIIDFGDGSMSNQVCGFGCSKPTTVSKTYTYSTAGTYVAKLKKIPSNSDPCTTTDCIVDTETVVVGQGSNQTFRVITPNGNEDVAVGGTMTVRWTVPSSVVSGNVVTLSLIPNTNTVTQPRTRTEIANVRASDGTFTWTPTSGFAAGEYKVYAELNNGVCEPVGLLPFSGATCNAISTILATDESDNWFRIGRLVIN